jgi:two-component system, cell cycle sensor histidine kinase and response regulator CckA
MSAAAEILRLPEDPVAKLLPFFANSPLGLALCQWQGYVTALNPALEKMLGIDRRVTTPVSLLDLLHAHDRPECKRLILELLEGKREILEIDSRAKAVARPLHWTAWRVEGTNVGAGCLVAMAEDLSGIPTEQHFRQTEGLQAVGRLAGGVAHDFNNLLTGVLLYCDLLMASLEQGHRARKYADEIRKAGLQATGLVRQLLAVARPTSTQPQLLSLNEIAEGMRTLLVRLIGENIELQLRLDPNLGLVKMDPSQAQQILLNLVLNARDAMPFSGRITVETTHCSLQVLTDSASTGSQAFQPCALLVVNDNGRGMDEATRAHLFEPFFTTKAAKGNGLGLSTVHDVVTTNGGLIHVESKLEQGTRVSVLLPIVRQSAPKSDNDENLSPVNFHSVTQEEFISKEED